MTSDLHGPLRYRIGTDAGPGKDGEVTEGGFGDPPCRHGTAIAYGNLLDQRDERVCGPYLKARGTAAQYREGVPDPRGPGFDQNVRMQCELASRQEHLYIELDNPDDGHFCIQDVLRATDIAAAHQLKLIAKNPLLLELNAMEYLAHGNVFGAIVENGAGDPMKMDGLRKFVSKPLLPVWFVFFGGSEARHAAQRAANIIRDNKRLNMGVTYDRADDEYGGDIVDFMVPQ